MRGTSLDSLGNCSVGESNGLLTPRPVDDTADCSAVDGAERWAAEGSDVSFGFSVTANTLCCAAQQRAPNTIGVSVPDKIQVRGRNSGAHRTRERRCRTVFRNV
ncbi:hypothetical protein GCM10009764_43350 [Nocardia ninae]|uniref:Uncharacterized protein n=1 Tax=Nocardia ninae NBRC 108245 TaxID=1210091 RepID=A0A511M8N4_9NOCA|nr:hypothetical protein NN4_15110 [Nocardia ninae NBRC 108245]